MSMTPSVGVYPISHWAYLATLLSQELKKCLESGEIAVPEHHKSLLIGIEDFFEPIKDYGDGRRNHVPDNPPAAVHAVCLYSKVLAELPVCRKFSIKKCLLKLCEIGDFVSALDRPRKMTSAEREIAELAYAFFVHVRELGNSESYTRVVGDPHYTYS